MCSSTEPLVTKKNTNKAFSSCAVLVSHSDLRLRSGPIRIQCCTWPLLITILLDPDNPNLRILGRHASTKAQHEDEWSNAGIGMLYWNGAVCCPQCKTATGSWSFS